MPGAELSFELWIAVTCLLLKERKHSLIANISCTAAKASAHIQA